MLCQGSDVFNITTTKLKRVFKLQYLLELLLEPDLFGKFFEEIGEKNAENNKKIQKTEGINITGITYLKPRLIELIIECRRSKLEGQRTVERARERERDFH